jgi:VanZ family protein
MKTKQKKAKKPEIEIEQRTPIVAKIMLTILIIYCLVIFYFAALPAEDVGSKVISDYAKLLHVLEFFGFIIISTITLFAGINWLGFWKINLIGVILAASTELVQLISPGRNCSIFDFGWDLLGMFLGWLVLSILFIISAFILMYLLAKTMEAFDPWG